MIAGPRTARAAATLALTLAVTMASARHGGAQVAAQPSAEPRPSVVVADAGPGLAGGIVRDVLARPHRLVPPGDSLHELARGEEAGTSLVVLSRDATIAGRVRGDVVVIGGDLFLRPGAEIDGRAVAIGGGVYRTTLGSVRGEMRSFRDETYDVVAVPGGYELRWRSLHFRPTPFLTWPGVFGIRIPDYDRVNGLSLAAGPFLSVRRGLLEVEPVLTYRSHLGAIDPDVAARLRFSRRTRVEGWIGRETRTNERWIHSDPVNSIAAISGGKDTRNYYRADGARVSGHRLWEWATGSVEPFVGGAVERAGSVGPTPETNSAPWSLTGRRDREEGMLRPNPPIDRGTLTSGLAGAAMRWESQGVVARSTVTVEGASRSPAGAGFVQTSTDARVEFPTFGTQTFRWEAHVVLTGGGIAPRQRWGWIGESGTVPLMELLEQGGDHVFFTESRYELPLERVRLPLVGSPTFMLRHMLGGAAVGRFPVLEQNVALRLAISYLRAEVVVDPARRQGRFRAGISLSR